MIPYTDLFLYNLITKLEQKGQPQKVLILLFAQRKLVSVQRETLEQKERKCFSRRCPEPVFLNLLRSPGIDSQTGGPVRHPYLTYRPARLHRLAESIPWNRLLGSLNVYKYGLSYQGFFCHFS
jgi:hypothetical protein